MLTKKEVPFARPLLRDMSPTLNATTSSHALLAPLRLEAEMFAPHATKASTAQTWDLPPA